MTQEELTALISKLRNMDRTNSFDEKIKIFESLLRSCAGHETDLIRNEFNRLANEIEAANKSEKED